MCSAVDGPDPPVCRGVDSAGLGGAGAAPRRAAPSSCLPGMVAVLCCSSPALAQAPAGVSAQPVLEEIIVTASRREQYVQDVPLSIQVMTGEELERLGRDSFEDYILTVPGASFRDQGNGAKRIGLRGISNLSGSDFGTVDSVSTIGLYLNDVAVQGTSVLPDLALYDLNRVEILKGPQGTLYGEGAMGGAIKMILNQPNLQRFEAKGEAVLSWVDDGGFNYQVRACWTFRSSRIASGCAWSAPFATRTAMSTTSLRISMT